MALNRIETDGIEDDAITTAKILDGTVGPADIEDGALTNTQINASAAIAVSKISGLGTVAPLDFGTGANQIVQLDGSGNLPALNASALTNLDAGDLTPSGTLPALNGSNLTNLTAGNLTGALPPISGANLTGVSTDTSAMENNIAILAFKTQSANDLAKFNLVDQVIDEYKDATGATYTTVSQVGSTATTGYLASVYTSSTLITPSSASDYTGETGSATIGSGTVEWNVGDDSMRSTNSITGDFEFTGKCTADSSQGGGWLGVFPVSEVGTFSGNAEHGAMPLMTNSYFLAWTSRAGITNGTNKGGSVQTTFNPVVNDVFKLTRVGSTITYYVNDVVKTTLTSQTTAAMYTCIGGTGAPGGTDYTLISWTTTSSSDNATGTATSTANTALTAPTTGDIVMLIEEVDGVAATLNTAGNDLRCAISRNGGASAGDWDYVTLVNKGLWGTNKKILVANGVPFSNSASGTDMRYKIEWANQAAAVAAGDTDHSTTTGWGESGTIANLFDNTTGTWLGTGGGGTQWFTTDLGSGKAITKYTMTSWAGSSNASPASWNIKGSNDTTNGSNGTWSSALDTKSGQSVWGSNEKRTFTFSNSTAYRYWKIEMSSTLSSNAPELAEMEYITTSSGTAARIVKVHATSLAWA